MTLPDDLACITSYFNPAGYSRRRFNYDAFRSALGVPLLTVECTFGAREPELPSGEWNVHVRARDVMWQKERLLNLALAKLPARFTKVAWVDADVGFDNPAWASEASRLLDDCQVVQLFEHVVRLGPDSTSDPRIKRSFAAECADRAASFDDERCRHGETGLAWAARRELLAHTGLYDACVVGGADFMMAHALYGWQGSPCITRTLQGAHYTHYRSWADGFFARVRGSVAYVRGNVCHSWHGPPKHRQYSERHEILARFEFDPRRDLTTGADGCLEWAAATPPLRDWLVKYFVDRREDDI